MAILAERLAERLRAFPGVTVRLGCPATAVEFLQGDGTVAVVVGGGGAGAGAGADGANGNATATTVKGTTNGVGNGNGGNDFDNKDPPHPSPSTNATATAPHTAHAHLSAHHHQSPSERLPGSAVVVTCPLGVLAADKVAFRPPLPSYKTQAMARTGRGALDKVALEFEFDFWSYVVGEGVSIGVPRPGEGGRWWGGWVQGWWGGVGGGGGGREGVQYDLCCVQKAVTIIPFALTATVTHTATLTCTPTLTATLTTSPHLTTPLIPPLSPPLPPGGPPTRGDCFMFLPCAAVGAPRTLVAVLSGEAAEAAESMGDEELVRGI